MYGVNNSLTSREREIAELIAWGASKKEVANRLFISERTVENHTRSIYEKTGCTKANELSAWWFCTTFHISFSLSPLKRSIIAIALLLVVLPSIFDNGGMFIRARRANITRTVRARARRKGDNEFEPFSF